MRILSEPKNALTKQYQKLFELDNVKLELPRSIGGDCQTGGRAQDRSQRTAFHFGKRNHGSDV
mgnify:CR=1 FL=1